MSHLGEQTWPRIYRAKRRPLLAVPIGSCEQHGPHLPLDTDTRIAVALAEGLVTSFDPGDVMVAPPLAISASGEHAGFPGTLSLGTDVFEGVITELVRSADWSAGVVLVNGHGGNVAAVDRAVAQLESEGRRVLAWWPHVAGGDPHAGHTETSLMLALRPELVRLERAVAGPIPSTAELVWCGVQAVSASGVLGDPRTASAEHGAELFRGLADDLARAIHAWLA
jgi:mycofactocin system creatininase family protein